MSNFTGDDLLNTFANLNVDLGDLNDNVIRGWYDTDCTATKELLNWMCASLSNTNYLDSLEKAEFDEIQNKLDLNKCAEELANLNPNYLSMLEDCGNLEDIVLIENEIELLQNENKDLDMLIKIYENVDSNISLELTNRTREEIKTKVECKNLQEICENLCSNLEESNTILKQSLEKYDPEAHLINFVNAKHYYENIENLESCLLPILKTNKTILENPDDQTSKELETCRRRILHSHQIFISNKMEIEKLKGIFEFLDKTNIDESGSWTSCATYFEAKELYCKRQCEVLSTIASKIADQHINQTKIYYLEQELQEFQQKSESISKLLENVNKCLSYYAVTNCLLLIEKQDVANMTNFHQKIISYINEDLHKCSKRTEQMNNIIADYNSSLASRKGNLISLFAKALNCDKNDLQSIATALSKFKRELNILEGQVFREDFQKKQKQIDKINEDIRILQKFLISGPTNRIVVVPMELQKIWLLIEEHLKKESESVSQAVQSPQIARKSMTKAQKYQKKLWISFLTDTSKVESILKQAEEEFENRMKQYF